MSELTPKNVESFSIGLASLSAALNPSLSTEIANDESKNLLDDPAVLGALSQILSQPMPSLEANTDLLDSLRAEIESFYCKVLMERGEDYLLHKIAMTWVAQTMNRIFAMHLSGVFQKQGKATESVVGSLGRDTAQEIGDAVDPDREVLRHH